MVSTAVLTSLRTEANRWLPSTADIQRYGEASDGAGGTTQSWSTIATAVACRIAPEQMRPYEQAIAGETTLRQSWIATFPQGTDINEHDRIVSGGVTYEVTAGMQTRSYEITCRVKCELLK